MKGEDMIHTFSQASAGLPPTFFPPLEGWKYRDVLAKAWRTKKVLRSQHEHNELGLPGLMEPMLFHQFDLTKTYHMLWEKSVLLVQLI